MDFIHTGPGSGSSVQNLSYLFDRVGNLTQRQDGNQSLSENFYYDDLHRLDSSTLNGAPGIDLAYDSYGNILSKVQHPIASNYSYSYTYNHPTKIHAVTSVSGTGPALEGYDITWFASNLPKRIRRPAGQSARSSEFQYAPSGARWRHAYSKDATLYTHVYIGSLLEKVTQGANVEWKHHIYANGDRIALYERHSSGTNTQWYLLKDHLGSTDVIADATGGVFVRASFDAYGKRRGTNWTGAPSATDLNNMNTSTRRGFTSHEHLDSTDLVHMNGRLYDPLVGRFISADPLIRDPSASQAWNRYAYVEGRALTWTDPSGWSPRRDYWRTVYRADPPRIEETRDADGNATYTFIAARIHTFVPAFVLDVLNFVLETGDVPQISEEASEGSSEESQQEESEDQKPVQCINSDGSIGNDTPGSLPNGNVYFAAGYLEGYIVGGAGGHLGVFYDRQTGNWGVFSAGDLGGGFGMSGGAEFGVASNLSSFQGYTRTTGAGYVSVGGNYTTSLDDHAPIAASITVGPNLLPVPPHGGIPVSAHSSSSYTGILVSTLPECKNAKK